MNSILLKTTDSGEELVMYGYANETQYTKAIYEAEGKIIFSGSKEELLSKNELWWSRLVTKTREYDVVWIFKGYKDGKALFNPRESGLSAISCLTHNNNILIIKRTKTN